MKSLNEEITDSDCVEMIRVCEVVKNKIDRAGKYGGDMRSSRLLLLREAERELHDLLFRIDSGMTI